MRGCVGRVLILALAVGLAVVAWQNRDAMRAAWDQTRGQPQEISPELAAQADAKLAVLGENGGERRVSLTAPELQSLIEYRWGGLLPPDVGSPRVGMSQGRVTLEATVATARFARVSELREIAGFLPDTAGLRAVGTFVPMEDGQVGLEVHEMSAASIPIPRQLIPSILGRFPGGGDPGLPTNAVAIPLPAGISTVFVSGDSMVFVANRARSD
jgi:hypothetical protein